VRKVAIARRVATINVRAIVSMRSLTAIIDGSCEPKEQIAAISGS
jgi:hypothetical protein